MRATEERVSLAKSSIPGLILAVCLAVAALAQSDSTTHHVVRDELRFDFGFMPDQAVVTHTFWLKNQTNDSIRVENVHLGCGCLSAPLPKQAIAPQDSVALAITFHSGHFKGHIEKKTRVTTRSLDSATAQVTLLTITGFVAPDSVLPSLMPVTFSPQRLEVGVSDAEQEIVLQPVIHSRSCDYRLVEYLPQVTVAVIRTLQGSYLRVNLPAEDILRQLHSPSITLEFDCDSSYNITIPIEVID